MINYHFQWKLSSGDLKGIGDKSMTKVTVEEDSDAVTAPLGYESAIRVSYDVLRFRTKLGPVSCGSKSVFSFYGHGAHLGFFVSPSLL